MESSKMNLDVLDIEPSPAEAEIFEASNDPFNACDDFLLGAIQETECWDDLLEMTNHEINEFSNIKYENKMLVEENCLIFPASFNSGDIDYLENVSDFLPECMSYDNTNNEEEEEEAMFTPALTPSGPNVDREILCLRDSSTTNASRDSDQNALHTQRRVRKPTRRYIDESADLNTRCVRKRVAVSTSLSSKDNKFHRVKHSKKPNERLALAIQPVDNLCEAIQVPFGPPLVPEECHLKPNQISLSGDNKCAPEVKKINLHQLSSFGPDNCHKRYELDVYKVKLNKPTKVKLMSGPEQCDNKKYPCYVKKENENHISSFGSKECSKTPTSDVNKVQTSDEEMSLYESGGDGARRKHHRLWTVSEVKKLIDGVSQCGVGRWSQIKKLYFSSSDHRTSVDLKDKWRNLLKASYLQTQSKKPGNGKQNFSWRPLPKPILHRVIELASVHPYPRNCKSNT